MEKGRISALQMSMIMYPAILATELLDIPAHLYNHAERDLWLSPIMASVVGYFLVWVAWRLHKRFPGETLIGMSERILGRFAGKLLSLAYLGCLLFNIAIIEREYGELILGRFLGRTPIYIIVGSLVLIAAMTVRGGLEVIGRLAQLVVPVMIIILFILICLLIPELQPDNMLPLFKNGLAPAFNGALFAQGWFCDYTLLLFMLPYIRNKDKHNAVKWGMISVASVAATMATVNLMILFLFGSITGDLTDPLMTASTYVSLGDFIQRVEPLVMGIWIMGCCVKIAIFLYLLCLGCSQWLRLSDYRPFVLPLGFLTVFLSEWVVRNHLELNKFLDAVYPYILTVYEGGIPLFLLIVAILFRRKSVLKE